MRSTAATTRQVLVTLALVAMAAGCAEEGGGAAGGGPVAGGGAGEEDPTAAIAAPPAGDRAKATPHLERARAALAAVDGGAARRALDAALAADPACAEALELLGWLLFEPGPDHDDGEALIRFTQLDRLGVRGGSVLGGAGIALAASGDRVRARPRLEAALAAGDLAPYPARLAKVHVALARLDAEAGRAGEAEAHLREALRLEPSAMARAEPLAQLGELLADAGRPEEAERSLREAIANHPDHVKSRYLLARLLARLGRAEEADREARIHELLRQLYDPSGSRFRADVDLRLRLRAELVAAAPESDFFAIASIRAQLDALRHADAERDIGALARRRKPTAELAYLLARARAGQGNLAGAEQARALMRQLDPKVPAALDRAIAEEWRRGVPGAGDDAVESLLARWRSP